jgi:predicted PurR-regulated permease PerM
MTLPTDSRTAAPPIKVERLMQLLLIVVMALGCWMVLEPFLPAILFSLAIVISTWPIHEWLLHKLHGRRVLASLASLLLVTLLVMAPAVLLIFSFRDAIEWVLGLLEQWQSSGRPELPQWIVQIPVIGEAAQGAWRSLTSGRGLNELLASFAEPAQRIALASGRALANGLLQLFIAVLLLYFLYRDGHLVARRAKATARLFGGRYAKILMNRAHDTITGTMISVIGTALAQATVAIAGFLIAGVPNPFLLGALTFALSIVPIGPPLIWGGAALWLFDQSQTGWAIFILIYGFFGISAVDNVLKPLLISRSSRLPFAFTLIGVIGGAFAFGVAGVVLGPILLALSLELLKRRLELERAQSVAS